MGLLTFPVFKDGPLPMGMQKDLKVSKASLYCFIDAHVVFVVLRISGALFAQLGYRPSWQHWKTSCYVNSNTYFGGNLDTIIWYYEHFLMFGLKAKRSHFPRDIDRRSINQWYLWNIGSLWLRSLTIAKCRANLFLILSSLLLAAVLMFNEKSKLLKLLFLHFLFEYRGEGNASKMADKWLSFPRFFFSKVTWQ